MGPSGFAVRPRRRPCSGCWSWCVPADWPTCCQDRATAYATAARSAAPEALQVADRFHLWKNLCEAVEKDISAHRSCLLNAVLEPDVSVPEADPEAVEAASEGRREMQRRERHAGIHALYDKGGYLHHRQGGLDPES
ncbi:transposase [Streptomyces sp. NPDC055085]